MKVFIIMGSLYNGNNDCFDTLITGVFSNFDEALQRSMEYQARDEAEGYLSNYYWVEEWEVK